MSVTFRDILSVFYKDLQNKTFNIELSQYKVKLGENINEQVLDIYTNDKKITSSKYELLGIYDESTNLFVWGSSLNPSDSNQYLTVKNIKNYLSKIKSFIINKKFNDVGYMEKMLYYLSENIIYLLKENINDFKMLCSYISKKIIVFKKDSNSNLISMFLLTDILSY